MFDDADATLVPMALVAVTVKWYVVPLVNPVTTRLVAAAPAGRRAPTCTFAALSTRTLYPVIAEPPLLAGTVHLTVADALPAVATPIPGADGAVFGAVGVTAFEVPPGPVPMALVAVTTKWYVVPLVRPVTTRLVAAAPAGRRAPCCTFAALSTWTENPVTAEPLFAPGVQLTVAWALPAVARHGRSRQATAVALC